MKLTLSTNPVQDRVLAEGFHSVLPSRAVHDILCDVITSCYLCFFVLAALSIVTPGVLVIPSKSLQLQ